MEDHEEVFGGSFRGQYDFFCTHTHIHTQRLTHTHTQNMHTDNYGELMVELKVEQYKL